MLAILVAFQVTEFFTAPQSPADYIKSQLAMKQVEKMARQTFSRSGIAGVKSMATHPIQSMGYTFTVGVVTGSNFNTSDGDFDVIEAYVSLYVDPNEAELATGRIYYDKKVLDDFNDGSVAYYDPPYQKLVAASMPLRTSMLELQRTPHIGS
jgi:hypothetical protein